jgi:uncharacterized protein DUF6655
MNLVCIARLRRRLWWSGLLALGLAGCGTTRMSDSIRTGTEQLLISDAVDRAINEMNFEALSGKDVYLDPQYLRNSIDSPYIESSLRQRLLASGCILKAVREDATYVVEARAGAVGTNRHDVLVGIPALSMPNTGLTPGAPSIIPEIPFAKSTQQKGVAKLAVFAYNQHTGQPVWQSGAFPIIATARDTWILGTGPFQRGSIYDGTRFAGSKILLPFARDKAPPPLPGLAIPVTAEASFQERPELAQARPNMLPPSSRPPSSPPPPAAAPAAAPPTSLTPDVSGGNGAAGIQGLLFLGNQGSFFRTPVK